MRADVIFEVVTSDRIIRLTQAQWSHISYRHPELTGRTNAIRDTLLHPLKIIELNNKKIKYYSYLKEERCFLMVAVRILNHHGFIMTAYFTRKI